MTLSNNCRYTIRKFLPEEVVFYKNMRLEALQLEAGMFASNYALEAAFTTEQWLQRIVNYNSACFGLYYIGELIGITGIVVDRNDASLAIMTQSYIRKAYRGKGLSHLLYNARIAWAKNKGLKSLQIGHKESNYSSKAANQHYGFRYTHRELLHWPDGSNEDILYYELKI